MIISTISFFIDCFLGDPQHILHPVVLIGKLIEKLDNMIYRKEHSNRVKLFLGIVLVFIVLSIVYFSTMGIIYFISLIDNEYISIIVSAFLLKMTISPRSLANAGAEIFKYLSANDLTNARKKVGWIVGRDTDNLTATEITRATVETIAENIVDGIISPLFFFAIGGVPLAMTYRAANTMDSMLGYKNEKYLYFGRFAAKLDDFLNLIPARITGILLIISAYILHYNAKMAWKMMLRDADKHPSPNGGYAEATVAGALGIRLGGLNYYFGQPHFRAYMGEETYELAPKHIFETTKMMYTTTILFLSILLCI